MKKFIILLVLLFALYPLAAGAQPNIPEYDTEPEQNIEVDREPELYQDPDEYDETDEYDSEYDTEMDRYDEREVRTRGYYGQDDYDYTIGDMEFIIVGSGSSDDDFDRTSFNSEAMLGYFMMEYLELFLRQSYRYADVSGDDDLWAATSRVGLDFVFDLARLKPFIGASFGYTYGDEEIVEDQFIAGPEVGLKYFATETAFIFGLMEYQFLFEDADEASDQFEDGRFVYSLGVGFTF